MSGVASLFTEEFYARLRDLPERRRRARRSGCTPTRWTRRRWPRSSRRSRKTFPDFVIYTIDRLRHRPDRAQGRPAGRVRRRGAASTRTCSPCSSASSSPTRGVIRRRAVGHWRTLSRFVGSYGMPANSDYFPIVDQRASRTRFTQARVTSSRAAELRRCRCSRCSTRRAAALRAAAKSIAVTYIDHATNDAWLIHDTILGARRLRPRRSRALGAQLEPWCAAGRSTAPRTSVRAHPADHGDLADRLNPRLRARGRRCASGAGSTSRSAAGRSARSSASGSSSSPRWRCATPGDMATTGSAAARRVKGQRSEASEYAFLAVGERTRLHGRERARAR